MDDPKRDQDGLEGDEFEAPDALEGIPGEPGSDIVSVEEEGIDEDDIGEDDIDDDDIDAGQRVAALSVAAVRLNAVTGDW
jgi:hypothetical protein